MNWSVNPEAINYSIALESEAIETGVTDEGENFSGTNSLVIGDRTFVNVPFTLTRNNKSISMLSINISDLIKDATGSGSSSTRFIKETIECHYYALSKANLTLLRNNMLASYSIDISNIETVNYTETANLQDSAFQSIFKTKAVKGDYKIDGIVFKKTIDDGLYDVKVTFIGTKYYETETADESLVVGSGKQFLKYKSFVDLEIWTQSGKKGTKLAINTDYRLLDYSATTYSYGAVEFFTYPGSTVYCTYRSLGVNTITETIDEIKTAVLTKQQLRYNQFYNLEIWTGALKTGTKLTAVVDYALLEYDSVNKVYNALQFVGHEGESFYFTYSSIGTENTTEQEPLTFNDLFEYFNILNNPGIEVYLTSSLINFDGYLSEITTSTITAMGKECKLLDVLFTENVSVTTQHMYNPETGAYEDYITNTILKWINYMLYYYRNDLLFSGGIFADYFSAELFDLIGTDEILFIDKNIWEILVSIAEALGLFMCAKDDKIIFSAGNSKQSYYDTDSTIINIPDSYIASKNISMKANKYYDGVKLSGEFKIQNQHSPRSIIIKGENVMYKPTYASAYDYITMENRELTSEEATYSDTANFEFTHDALPGVNCSISMETLTFIDETVPVTTELINNEGTLTTVTIADYTSSIKITVRPDCANEGIHIGSVSYIAEPGTDARIKPFLVPSLGDYTHIKGIGYVHIFGAVEDIHSITIIAVIDGFFDDTLLENYYENNSLAKYVYSHSNNLIQKSSSKTLLDLLCTYLLEIQNSKMKQISLELNTAFDLYPGDIINVSTTSVTTKKCTVDSVSISYDKKNYKTSVVCYE